MTFRWFGPDDPVRLENIRQIPGVTGVVSALYDVPVGEAWPADGLARLAERVDASGMRLSVVESIPVHEDIKLGRPTRDRLADQYAESVRRMGELGIPVLCYNFMPVLDWTRTDLGYVVDDGSKALRFDAIAFTAANFISSLIVLALTSKAPLKMNGNPSTLFT